MARDYYGILGVDRNASDADIKKAFRRKARKYHPDVNDSAEAADKFNELKIAQEVLTDPQKRSIVDAGGAMRMHGDLQAQAMRLVHDLDGLAGAIQQQQLLAGQWPGVQIHGHIPCRASAESDVNRP